MTRDAARRPMAASIRLTGEPVRIRVRTSGEGMIMACRRAATRLLLPWPKQSPPSEVGSRSAGRFRSMNEPKPRKKPPPLLRRHAAGSDRNFNHIAVRVFILPAAPFLPAENMHRNARMCIRAHSRHSTARCRARRTVSGGFEAVTATAGRAGPVRSRKARLRLYRPRARRG